MMTHNNSFNSTCNILQKLDRESWNWYTYENSSKRERELSNREGIVKGRGSCQIEREL